MGFYSIKETHPFPFGDNMPSRVGMIQIGIYPEQGKLNLNTNACIIPEAEQQSEVHTLEALARTS